MQKIKRLALHEAQKIAAGEVVERPANVVKELIENSIDAGATTISVYLENGGKTLIRIVDNGCGMSAQDAQLCFEQHATSKITSVDDLNTIGTFGFRGEALASIAAVSEIILITKETENSDDAGLKRKLKAGAVSLEEPVSCHVGTDISIKNLFYNLPARQKFLKKKETESRHITQLLHAFCLDYLHIHFRFFQDTKEQINAPATNDIVSRIAQLWDHTFAGHMIKISAEDKTGIKISGAVSNHQYFRYDRNNLFLFVNKRWIKDVHLSRALMRGYQNVLPPARFPAACIFIEVDSGHVDVNIHPRKEEVQFLHPRAVATLLQNTVKQALEDHLSAQLKKTVTFAPQTTFDEPQPRTSFSPPPSFTASSQPQHKPFGLDAALSQEPFTPSWQPPQNVEEKKQTTIISQQPNVATEKNYELIGQYKKTYLLLEKQEGLFLIDQHAAHERILYELFSSRFHDVATIKLMFPQTIDLCAQDIQTLVSHLDVFKKNGIEIEQFSDTQLVVKSTPVHIKNIKLDELVKQVAAWIREFDGLDEQQFFKSLNEKMHAQMACKAAVKAGDVLTREQMEKLLDDLHTTNNRLTCPHGRPTGWLLSVYEIEKKFKRKV